MYSGRWVRVNIFHTCFEDVVDDKGGKNHWLNSFLVHLENLRSALLL